MTKPGWSAAHASLRNPATVQHQYVITVVVIVFKDMGTIRFF